MASCGTGGLYSPLREAASEQMADGGLKIVF